MSDSQNTHGVFREAMAKKPQYRAERFSQSIIFKYLNKEVKKYG